MTPIKHHLKDVVGDVFKAILRQWEYEYYINTTQSVGTPVRDKLWFGIIAPITEQIKEQ